VTLAPSSPHAPDVCFADSNVMMFPATDTYVVRLSRHTRAGPTHVFPDARCRSGIFRVWSRFAVPVAPGPSATAELIQPAQPTPYFGWGSVHSGEGLDVQSCGKARAKTTVTRRGREDSIRNQSVLPAPSPTGVRFAPCAGSANPPSVSGYATNQELSSVPAVLRRLWICH
jgi:hypothetical protein